MLKERLQSIWRFNGYLDDACLNLLVDVHEFANDKGCTTLPNIISAFTYTGGGEYKLCLYSDLLCVDWVWDVNREEVPCTNAQQARSYSVVIGDHDC